MFADKELLEKISAVDLTPREIKTIDYIEIYCHFCEQPRQSRFKDFGNLFHNLKKKGYGWSCQSCASVRRTKSAPKERVTKIYTSDQLKEMGLVDTTPRNIKGHHIVQVICPCGVRSEAKLNNIKESITHVGRGYRCSSCAKKEGLEKRSRNTKWLENIRNAAQSEYRKNIARDNAQKKIQYKSLKNIEEYWDFMGNTLFIKGTDNIIAKCRSCESIEEKPLKKLIEAANSITHGCSNCWGNFIKTEKYSHIMKNRSTPAGSEARERQSVSYKEYWNNKDESFRKAHGLKSKDWWNSLSEEDQSKRIKDMVSAPRKKGKDRFKGESEIRKWISELGLDVSNEWFTRFFNITNKNTTMEIDAYIPSLRIGIEHHGLIHHSELFKKNKNYHLEKYLFFKNEWNINLIQIFEHEWKYKKKQVKNFLKSKFGLNEIKVGARKCLFSEIPKDEAALFLSEWHIQGTPGSIIFAIGAYYDGNLIAVCSFGHHHRKKGKVVLNRLAFKENHSVPGALSKFTKMALKRYDVIYTWVDKRFSDASSYIKSGWLIEEVLPPDYFYVSEKEKNVYSKQSRRKSAVKTPEGMTEHEHAIIDGLYRVYDCGKIRLVAKKNKY